MTTLRVSYLNSVHCRLEGPPGVLSEVRDHFVFDVPGAKFTPKFKSGYWDGKIKLYSYKYHTLYAGLTHQLQKFCADRGYEYESDLPEHDDVDDDDIRKFIRLLKIPPQFEVRDYQFETIKKAINEHRQLFLSPTSSGKSLMIYVIMRWYMALLGMKALVIVPRKSLVLQMAGDFTDYGAPAADIHKISGGERWTSKEITVSTWQSISKMDQEWYDQFGIVIGDEAHRFTGKSLTGIMEKMTDCWVRIGLTGSLDGSKCHKMVLEGLFGPITTVTTTKELEEQGYVAKMKPHVLMLHYTDEERRKKRKFPDEMDFLINHPRRNAFLCDLASHCKGNTLLLFHRVDQHGIPLYEQLSQQLEGTGRKVYLIHGKVSAAQRERVRQIIERENDAIIVASTGTFSEGINIKRLHNVISATSWRSRIINLQSIGRGLRIGSDKVECNWYDVSDDLSWKKRKNYTLIHCHERIKLYAEQGFQYKIIDLWP